ncbi:Hypothetical predicted protein [Mytilus galloprovincialis]|uniref:Uncharacterized protein n=1 Tax=Mytilus galloprovincialis TaxID=29158 RepID=A0A8B6FQM3_MYTGA|nr:Hypothetical predicted protein [Mytilus galloprovincialis]
METTTTSTTAQRLENTPSFPMIVKTTNFQFTKNQQKNNEQRLVILLVMIPVVLLGGCITIVGVLARVKETSIEQDNTVENQLYQNSHVPQNGNSSEPDIPFTDRPVHGADLGSETGATSNYRNTDESTAVKLYECTPGLHYAEVLIKPVESLKNKIHGIENKTIYSGIDHSISRCERRADHSDNEREDDSIYIQNLDIDMRNYENTCLQ